MQLLLHQLIGKVWTETQYLHKISGQNPPNFTFQDIFQARKKFLDISKTSGISRTCGHSVQAFTTKAEFRFSSLTVTSLKPFFPNLLFCLIQVLVACSLCNFNSFQPKVLECFQGEEGQKEHWKVMT